MNLALIKFSYKHEARAILRKLNKYQQSSIYKINSDYYLLIKSSNSIISLNLTNLSSIEHELFNWAKSEIENLPEFIIYETRANLAENGRLLVTNYGEIIRIFEYLAEVFGILNYTDDSFSDGGEYNNLDTARNRIVELVNSGIRVIDIGVESTRPNAKPLISLEEINRLNPLLDMANELRQQYKFELSIDTYHTDTVVWLQDKNIEFINDVSGHLPNNLVLDSIKSGKKYIAMHSLGIPASKEQVLELTINPINHISSWMKNKICQFDEYNIDLSKVIFDPGIGFGNNSAQAWYIINNISQFKDFGVEVLLGHSRKSFIGAVSSGLAKDRDLASGVIAGYLANTLDYLRLHDITFLNKIYPLINQLDGMTR